MITNNSNIITEFLVELENMVEDDQKQRIKEMNGIMDNMNEDEFKSVFTKELFDSMYKMIEDEKLSMDNAILLLKRVGYCKVLKEACCLGFEESSLDQRFKKMIVVEYEKKEEKDEKLFVDLCECYLMLNDRFFLELLLICVTCLLKVASNKEENEETRKEVEMAFLALTGIGCWGKIGKKLYLNKLIDIIKYQQMHRNLSPFACESAWKFLINRMCFDRKLERAVVKELHFAREAANELEELSKCVDWKKKKEEMSREETKEDNMIKRWIQTLTSFFSFCQTWNEENSNLIVIVVRVFREAKENRKEISLLCIQSLRKASENNAVEVDDLLKGEAIDAIMEENFRSTLNDEITSEILKFFQMISSRLKEKGKGKMEEAKRKTTKREIFDNLEEEGYEDIITSFHDMLTFSGVDLNAQYEKIQQIFFVNV